MAMHNKWIKLTAAAILAGGLLVPGVASAAVAFTDIETSYAKESILALAEAGILNGVGGGKFHPGGQMTREQFAKMLVIGGGLDVTLEEVPYADNADPNAWYYNYVRAISQHDIMIGTGPTTFGVGQSMTREMAVVAIMRALGLESAVAAKAGAVSTFADEAQVSSWAKPHLALAQELGIINGVGGNTFAPQTQTTREMASKMLYEAMVQMQAITSAVQFKLEYYAFVASALNQFSITVQTHNLSSDLDLSYRVRFTDATGRPVANQVVHYETAPGVWEPNQTDADGVVVFQTADMDLTKGVTVKLKTSFANEGEHFIHVGLVNTADHALLAEGPMDVTVLNAPGVGIPELTVKEASFVIVGTPNAGSGE